MRIQPCRSYRAKVVKRRKLIMPGTGKSVFKLYFISIVGREQPERYEWGRCTTSVEEFEQRFLHTGIEGIGFLTVFPHITKAFVYAPAAEILMYVKAFSTPTLEPIDLGREDEYTEFACYAEAILAADEYNAWAEAHTVAEYVEYWSPFEDGPIANHAKLAAHWSE